VGASGPAPTAKRSFLDIVRRGRVPPIYVEVPYRSPADIYPAFAGPQSVLLESVKGPPHIARYSFIGYEPAAVLRLKDGRMEIKPDIHGLMPGEHPLRVLDHLLRRYPQTSVPGLPPFQGGLAGLFAYDFLHYLERVPATTTNDLRLPEAHFLLLDRVVAFDHLKRSAWAIVAPGVRDEATSDWSGAYDQAREVLARMQDTCERPPTVVSLPRANTSIDIHHDTGMQRYADMVRRTKAYIAAGDIFQANLSLRVSAGLGRTKPWDLYRVLRSINPSPFAGFLDLGDFVIASSSPERLVRVRDGVVDTRPIAGTRPRGTTPAEDKALRADLLLNAKERAEHIMLIDLERNDLGRVCRYGSVGVDELMTTEDYSHVIHIVSNVKGMLARGKALTDVVRAVFPGGTITGVPKVRCMEIIDELEDRRRGPYTGSFGYMGYSGAMDLNIVIRTFTITGGRAYVQAGAGIVADSDPLQEYQESLKKAEALMKTLEQAVS
jgi:aminodeoxychorismate synthase component I